MIHSIKINSVSGMLFEIHTSSVILRGHQLPPFFRGTSCASEIFWLQFWLQDVANHFAAAPLPEVEEKTCLIVIAREDLGLSTEMDRNGSKHPKEAPQSLVEAVMWHRSLATFTAVLKLEQLGTMCF